MELEIYSPEMIQLRLKRLKKTQGQLATLFNRKPSQISNAINTELYPTLRNKIINYIEKLEEK